MSRSPAKFLIASYPTKLCRACDLEFFNRIGGGFNRSLLGLKVSARARCPHRIVEPFDREVVDVPN
jgi:hypothetical protein